jgi:hypothetical protein
MKALVLATTAARFRRFLRWAIQLHLALKICRICATPCAHSGYAFTICRKSGKEANMWTCVWYNVGGSKAASHACASDVGRVLWKLGRPTFGGRKRDRRRRVRAGSGKLGYFTANLDFGLIGEIAAATGAANSGITCCCKTSCDKWTASLAPPAFTTAPLPGGGMEN